MAKTLNPRRKKLADRYLETGNGTKAALEIYDVNSDEAAAVTAHRVLRDAKVQQYLQDKAERAAIRVVELSEQEKNMPVALGASKDILDRAGYGAIAKTESKALNVNINGQISKNPELEALDREYEDKVRELYARGKQ